MAIAEASWMMSAHESKGNCSLNSLRKFTPFLSPAFAP